MGKIVVRRAEKKDAHKIYEFVCALEGMVFDSRVFIKYFEACIAEPRHYFLIAIADGVPVGFISCYGQLLLHHLGWVYEIQEMFVVPEYRSQGIGSFLLRQLEQILAGEECVLLEVTSNRKREAAHRFYLDNGFQNTSFKFGKVIK